jgi:hypothetical protein
MITSLNKEANTLDATLMFSLLFNVVIIAIIIYYHYGIIMIPRNVLEIAAIIVRGLLLEKTSSRAAISIIGISEKELILIVLASLNQDHEINK